jgi:Zn-dependent metalloprotease
MIGKTKSSYGANPDNAVAQFILQHRNLLGIQENDFDLTQTKETEASPGARKYQYQQQYRGVPVLHSGYLISVSEGGFIDYISGDFYDDISLETNPKVSTNEVVSIIIDDIGTDAFSAQHEPVLAIYPSPQEKGLSYQLVYSMDVFLEDDTGAWRFFIDAQSGEVFRKKSLLSHETITEGTLISLPSEPGLTHTTEANSASSMLINGSGTVYKTSPNFSGTSVQTLYRLDNLSPRKLRGDNITVDYYNNTDASSSTGSFNYSTSNAHFDEVMVYYHGDVFEGWLIGKGMGNTRVGKVTATTRYYQGYAYAIPSQRKIFFEDGEIGLNNPTKEAAVIVHEYMHVVSETYHDLELNLETDAMDEAYSDYFGLAYRNTTGNVSSSVIGEYIDQPGGINYTRNLNNSYTMDNYASIDFDNYQGSSYHEKSVILSGALWDLRNDPNVNAGTVDELVLASLGNLDASPSYLDAMYALIAAANTAGKSSYVDDIEDAFIAKKIFLDPPSPPTNFTLTNPGGSFPSFTWNASSGATSYKIFRRCFNGYYGDCTSSYQEQGSTTGTSWTDYSVSQNFPGQEDTYRYAVKAYDSNGNVSGYSNSQDVNGQPSFQKRLVLPEQFTLSENYPNPFNPSTQIKFELPEAASVTLTVYNVMGQKVATLVQDRMEAGFHNQTFDAGGLASGVYIVRLTAIGSSGEQFVREIKMQLIK